MSDSIVIKLFHISLFLLTFLFWDPSSFSHQKRPALKGYEDNRIPLSLIGVVISKNNSSSLAILKNKRNGKTVILTLGDRILGMELIHVFEGGVVLRKEGKTYLIFFGRSELIYFDKIAERSQKANDIFHPEDELLVGNQFESEFTEKEFIRSEATKRIKQEWPLIRKETRVEPNYIRGKMSGLKIISLPKRGIISETGICKNDVIKEVNGVVIDDLSKLFKLYSNIFVEDRFEILIERDGKLMKQIYTLK